MIKTKLSVDIIYLSILGVSLFTAIYLHFVDGYVLSANYYVGCICWLIISVTKLIKLKKQFYGVLILLFLATFDIVNFTFFTVNTDLFYSIGGIAYNGVGLNFIFLGLLIVYGFTNKEVIINLKKLLIGGSHDEQQQKKDKMITFYYQQFNSCNKDEFEKAIKNIDSYPIEAQVALKDVVAEMNSKITEYLVGIVYHDINTYVMWERGLIEDYESSTGIFITANCETEAIKWAEQIAAILFRRENPGDIREWESFGYDCWIENIENSVWKHCYSFFQKISYGEYPDFNLMGTDAYKIWMCSNDQSFK